MELVILMMKELIEMIESLQFRCYLKFGMGLYKLMCKNQTTVTIFSITVICFKESEEEGGTALYGGRSKKFQSCVQILMTSFIDYVLVRS